MSQQLPSKNDGAAAGQPASKDYCPPESKGSSSEFNLWGYINGLFNPSKSQINKLARSGVLNKVLAATSVKPYRLADVKPDDETQFNGTPFDETPFNGMPFDGTQMKDPERPEPEIAISPVDKTELFKGASEMREREAPQQLSIHPTTDNLSTTTDDESTYETKKELYFMIQEKLPVRYSHLAGKITGMLLNALDTSGVIDLIFNRHTLKDIIDEALRALDEAGMLN
jgi:hypothetical protein